MHFQGSYVLSNAMDNTLRVWDVRPFVTTDRCVKIITGHKHNFEKVYIQIFLNTLVFLQPTIIFEDLC